MQRNDLLLPDEYTSPTVDSDDAVQLSHGSEVWAAITSVLRELSAGAGRLFRAIRQGTAWFARNVLLRIGHTGANILGYFFDKVLYGSPGLRPYLHDGFLTSEVPEGWRNFVRDNTGWDIYETMHPVLNNIFGIFGAGVGVLNFFNHLATSFCRILGSFYHVLGENGVFGTREEITDDRNLPIKIVFGFLSSPLVFIPLVITNSIDVIFAVIKNFFISYGYNVKRTFNLLGNNGVMGERQSANDERNMPAQVIYGILSAPFVFVTSLITNIIDGFCALAKNFFLSYGFNVKRTFNLLGNNGVMGERQSANDERGLPAQVIYGILSAPFVFATSLITNIIDGFCAYIKNFFLSYGFNVKRTFNLLGNNGVMGERQSANDDRNMPAQVIYGIFSAPFVFATSLITNIIDGFCAYIKNFFLSYGFNVKRTFNLLGNNGVMGERQSANDDRNMPAQVIYGILSAPFVLVTSVITNVIDGFCSLAKNFFLSYGYNVKRTFNLLGNNGVMGERQSANDDRNMPAQVIYGILSAPFVFATSLITNIIDGFCALAKNFFLSYGCNVKRTFNLLGTNGVMGERRAADDERGLPAQVIYGIFSAPFVFATSLITNITDGFCALAKNFFLSYGYNVKRTFNLLGTNGVMGERRSANDERSLPAQVIYGILSAPFVFATSLITNIIDGFCALAKNFFLSYGYNVKRTFNLLGTNGVMGERRSVNDERGMPAQVIYGIFSAPFVFVTSAITNTLDSIFSFCKNFAFSFARNLRKIFNLPGDYGVMGPRRAYDDNRGIVARVIYGILSAPFVAAAAFITNIIDGFCAGIKNRKKFILKPLTIIVGTIAFFAFAIPTFVIRKTLKGIYNLTIRPFVDCSKGRKVSSSKILTGALNIVTLGLFGAAKKIFKAATDYTSRFGFPSSIKHKNQDMLRESEPLLSVNYFNLVQEKFRIGILMATKGKFPEMIDWQRGLRPVVRGIYGFRHKSEELLKKLHDAYREYANTLGEAKTSDKYNMFHFFRSAEYNAACASIQPRQGEEQFLDKIKFYLASDNIEPPSRQLK